VRYYGRSILGLLTVLMLCASCKREEPGHSELIRQVASEDVKERLAAIEKLVPVATDADVEQVGAILLGNGSEQVRAYAAYTLELAKNRKAVPDLIKALQAAKPGEWLIRAWSIRALATIGDERGNEPVFSAIHADGVNDADTRIEYARAFAVFKNPKSVPLLIPMIEYDNPKNQATINNLNIAVAKALGHQGNSGALRTLQRLLDNADINTARAAAGAIGKIVGENFDEPVQIERFMTMQLPSPPKAKAWMQSHAN